MQVELAIVPVIVGFAMVQSVFGVGLLVFGTPTLLLMGLSFETTLAYLLPSSIVISVLQLVGSGGLRLDPMRWQFLAFTAPLVLLGTAMVLTVGAGLDIRLIVAGMLIVSGVLRLLAPARVLAARLARRNLPVFLSLLGVIHGLSNLGGGVLTVIVASVYNEKEDVRRQIAFAYGLMASIQLVTLWMASSAAVVTLSSILVLPMLAGATYLALGNRAFRATTQSGFQASLTALIIVFGLILLMRP